MRPSIMVRLRLPVSNDSIDISGGLVAFAPFWLRPIGIAARRGPRRLATGPFVELAAVAEGVLFIIHVLRRQVMKVPVRREVNCMIMEVEVRVRDHGPVVGVEHGDGGHGKSIIVGSAATR